MSGAALRPRGASDVLVPTNPLGETRLDTFQQIDTKVEKVFRVRTAKMSGSFELFNLANSNTVLTRERQLNSTTAGNARGILACNAAAFDEVLPIVREIAEEQKLLEAE